MLDYLNWLKKNTNKKLFKEILEDVTRGIKVNNINFEKKTSPRTFIELCKISHRIHLRCEAA